MNIHELGGDRQPRWWMFLVISVPITIAMAWGLYRGNKWWKSRFGKHRQRFDKDAAFLA